LPLFYLKVIFIELLKVNNYNNKGKIMGRDMGFDFGLEKPDACFIRKFRWLFSIEGVCADERDKANCLPPSKSARPSISFKSVEVNHLSETLSYPSRADWKPITLSLYDMKLRDENPVFKWLKTLYDPTKNEKTYKFPIVKDDSKSSFIKPGATLELFDGCGTVIEKWKYECVWPESIEWGELDYSNSDICTCDISLKYARAYMIKV
jgi:hypothetical protein